MQTITQKQPQPKIERPPFQYLVVIEPLGFLYGSAGKFLSPENLVGRSGTSFPPSAATLSGLFAAEFNKDQKELLDKLQLVGPFWAKTEKVQNFYVPTPFNCLVKDGKKDGKIDYQMTWKNGKWQVKKEADWETPPVDKFQRKTWLAIQDWPALQQGKKPVVQSEPWKFLPHLHPRLEEEQRRVVDPKAGQGSLFLENSVQLNPETCLIYLSNTELPTGCYRFGGEGHLVDLRCEEICDQTRHLLQQPVGQTFATITPAVWGSNRLSYRAPRQDQQGNIEWPGNTISALLTERPTPMRYRLGNSPNAPLNAPKRLSRGRYAMPAGSVYVLEHPIELSWQDWPDDWFPTESHSFKRWGCGLSLPLMSC